MKPSMIMLILGTLQSLHEAKILRVRGIRSQCAHTLHAQWAVGLHLKIARPNNLV